ncbi:MAG: hypothetical protein EBS90_09415 [Betaproteobacteria bacterium]|nr:hypothetical protein [Betaproteobacteria bacterium]
MNSQSRKVTCQLLDMMDQGAIDPKALVEMCLQYMSEADVADMAQSNDLLLDEEEEEDAA